MHYNIWFNVCALLVLAVLLILYALKFHAPFKKYCVFLALMLLSTVSTIASICNNTLPGIAPIWVLQLSNTIYFLAHNAIPPMLLLYVYSLTDFSLTTWRRLILWLIPSVFSFLLILTSWFSNGLYWLDASGGYHRGSMMPLLYLVAVYHFTATAYCLYFRWNLIPRHEGISIASFLVISAGAMTIQLLFPQLLVENFASALCMMISQMTVQNPDLIMDSSTGMLNKRGLSNLITPQFEMHQPFSIGFLLVDNYHTLERNYIFSRLESRLVMLADYIKQHPGVTCSRVNNRLFCFFPENIHCTEGWNTLMRDLESDALLQKLQHDGIGIRFQFKTGCINCPKDASSFGELMEVLSAAATIPMHQHDSVMWLSSVDISRMRRRKRIDELVRTAVQDGSLHVVYQPVYDVQKQRFCSAEALLRMTAREFGYISPAEFIPVAEENGAIVAMTQFVAESACQLIQNAARNGWLLDQIHINLSAIDCIQGNLSQRILEEIRRFQLDPSALSVEITETAFTSMPKSILQNLTELSEAGVDILLDDYGTGYSNLSRLYSIPLDVVKLDKTLVDDITHSEAARIVLENTIHMMLRLNKQVLVEGVETREQADYLISQGVRYIQGYYYAKPMSGEQLTELFRNQSC